MFFDAPTIVNFWITGKIFGNGSGGYVVDM